MKRIDILRRNASAVSITAATLAPGDRTPGLGKSMALRLATASNAIAEANVKIGSDLSAGFAASRMESLARANDLSFDEAATLIARVGR